MTVENAVEPTVSSATYRPVLQPREPDHRNDDLNKPRHPPFRPRGKDWFKWKAIRLRQYVCRVIYPRTFSLGDCSFRIGPHTVLKRGLDITEGEAEAMRFVAAHTTIPVPRVHRSYTIAGMVHIEMDYVKGECPISIWNHISPEEKKQLMTELEGYVKQLRTLPPPYPEAVCAVNGASAHDHRFGLHVAGPFLTHDEFHRFLRLDSDLDSWNEEECKEVYLAHSKKYASKFTHGDLAPRNVLVRDGHIVAILDWDSAGWRPEYWEVTKERYSDLGTPEEWHEAVRRGVGQNYELELAAERHLYCPGAFTEFPTSPKRSMMLA
ncbi:hypothetical protein DENSPDRAFT_617421 [Dentipellis sp. KUC8613]|nr:hypothetical protein DENSPDRAFT_617421 [Dentipellis sp. KUC8613]